MIKIKILNDENILTFTFTFHRDSTRTPSDQDVGGVFESQLKPQFKMKPNDTEVREGHTVRFDTLVTGRPAPELTWFCNDRKVFPDDHHKVCCFSYF
jgi:hypothetical protein